LGLAMCGAAIVGGIIAWVSSYLQVKAQNFAKKEDFNELKRQLQETTAATEEIKAEISGKLWVKQKLWDVKLRSYSDVLDNRGEAPRSAEAFRLFVLRNNGAYRAEDEDAEFSTALEKRNAAVLIAIEKIRRSAGVARFVVRAENRTLLSEIADQWNETVTHD